ncbi:DUF4228 domain-containing protein [Cephalotus follicularis]|uniref:DUF4228 domain-containing protein n=1 Tax=Cephalotus follicularis TaxID=3775 RepID=A0A1Q3CQT6_CEPFO|nr:DUF4228 domain-containing protein [Cephalotus follicularis]
MGNNLITYSNTSLSNTTGKVILSNGTVYEFDRLLTVAELMLEHPQQVVVEFNSQIMTQKRAIPLPADKKLDMKKLYLMLPMKRGKPASLSSEEARHVLLSAINVLRSKSLLSSSGFLPLFAKICPAAAATGEGQSCGLSKKEIAVERDDEPEFMPESLGAWPDQYLSRQISGKGWKPSLDTIKEIKIVKRAPHWLLKRATS